MAYNEIYPNKIYLHRTIHLGLLSGRAIPHENAIVRDLAFQEVVDKLNSM